MYVVQALTPLWYTKYPVVYSITVYAETSMLRTEQMDKNGPFYPPPSILFHMGRSIPQHSNHNAFSNKAHFHGNVQDGEAYLGLPNSYHHHTRKAPFCPFYILVLRSA